MKNYKEIAGNWIERGRVYGLRNSIGLFKNLKKDGVFSLNLNGQDFFLRGNSVDFTVINSIFARKEYDIDFDFKPAVIIDAGANIGASTVFFRWKYPDARILAIEPERNNFDLLSRNAGSYSGISLENSALWHENTDLVISNPNADNYAFQVDVAKDNTIPVRGVTIDNLMERWSLPWIDILKADIEGAERHIFRASYIPWLKKVRILIIELHEACYPGITDIFQKALRGLDCEVFQRGENHIVINKTFEP